LKPMNVNQLSEQLLLAVKMQQPTGPLTAALEKLSFEKLAASLNTDDRKLAFWVNIYNAFFQILSGEGGIGKPQIYSERMVTIGGTSFSLDDIEHGILRRYRWKWSLGYLPGPFARPAVKKLAVSKRDYRIHFALNCGAVSCPPIAFYSPEKIAAQLDMATLSFLEAETGIFPGKKEIHITWLFQWFAGDFGGRSGIRRILQEKLNIETAGWKLVFKDYDREEKLAHFTELNPV
jgi:Protein of unknown function, DUF547